MAAVVSSLDGNKGKMTTAKQQWLWDPSGRVQGSSGVRRKWILAVNKGLNEEVSGGEGESKLDRGAN